jgi:hypothetical protein
MIMNIPNFTGILETMLRNLKGTEGANSSKQGGKITGHRKVPGSQKFPLLHVSKQSTNLKKIHQVLSYNFLVCSTQEA